MPDVAVATDRCPICRAEQPAAEAYLFKCLVCGVSGMGCCIEVRIMGVRDGMQEHAMLCGECAGGTVDA